MCVVFDVLPKILWSFYFSSNTFKFNINLDVPNIPLQTFPENLNTLPLYFKASTIKVACQFYVHVVSVLTFAICIVESKEEVYPVLE